jgi:hypothetical protein
MIYVPCQHERRHNGGWMEEQHFLIGGRDEQVVIAPCMLLRPRSGRVQSWLETVAALLHRRIVHEFVLRQFLLQRYGQWFDFRSVGELLRGLPVFYRYRSDRYYLLRDVVPYLPKVRRNRAKTLHRAGEAGAKWAQPVHVSELLAMPYEPNQALGFALPPQKACGSSNS